MSENPDLKKSYWTVKRIAILIIFIALSAVGSLIKIPSPVGSIGLDSCPGLFCALAFGYPVGAIVIAVGHMLTSAIVGFPMSLPVHIVLAIGMGILAVVFRFIHQKMKNVDKNGLVGLIIAIIVVTLLNSFALGLIALPLGGWGMYFAIIPSLLVASAVNTIIAGIAYFSLRNSRLLN